MTSILIFLFNIYSLLFVSYNLVFSIVVLRVFSSRYGVIQLEWFTDVSLSYKKFSHLKACQLEGSFFL